MCGGSGCGASNSSDWRWIDRDRNTHDCGGGC